MAWLNLFSVNILPIFLVAAGGYWAGKRLNVHPRTLARVVFYLFSPALVYQLMAANTVGDGTVGRIAGLAVALWALLAGAAWLAGRWLGLSRPEVAALVLIAAAPNAGNYGLSLNRFALGTTGLAFASVYFIVSSVLLYSAGVFVASLGQLPWRQALQRTLRMPVLWAALLGWAAGHSGFNLPLPLERAVDLLAQATIPTLLVLLGVQMAHAEGNLPPPTAWVGIALRLLGAPLLALFLHPLLNLHDPARAAAILEAAMPVAVTTTVLATEFDTCPSLVSQAVFWSTLLSPLTITPLLAYLGVG